MHCVSVAENLYPSYGQKRNASEEGEAKGEGEEEGGVRYAAEFIILSFNLFAFFNIFFVLTNNKQRNSKLERYLNHQNINEQADS